MSFFLSDNPPLKVFLLDKVAKYGMKMIGMMMSKTEKIPYAFLVPAIDKARRTSK